MIGSIIILGGICVLAIAVFCLCFEYHRHKGEYWPLPSAIHIDGMEIDARKMGLHIGVSMDDTYKDKGIGKGHGVFYKPIQNPLDVKSIEVAPDGSFNDNGERKLGKWIAYNPGDGTFQKEGVICRQFIMFIEDAEDKKDIGKILRELKQYINKLDIKVFYNRLRFVNESMDAVSDEHIQHRVYVCKNKEDYVLIPWTNIKGIVRYASGSPLPICRG